MDLVTHVLSTEFPADQAAYETQDLVDLAQTYRGPRNAFFVAEEDHRIVGTCGVKADSPETAILRRLFVDSQHRGKGIGSSLLKQALEFCRIQDFREVIIRTSSRMEQAARLCQAVGFKPDGIWSFGPVTLMRYRLPLR